MSEYIVQVEGQMPDTIYERELTEIVRCRDCKHFNGWACTKSSCSYCGELQRVEPDGFCAWGERRG